MSNDTYFKNKRQRIEPVVTRCINNVLTHKPSCKFRLLMTIAQASTCGVQAPAQIISSFTKP